MNLVAKLASVVSNPSMLSAYARWSASWVFTFKAPRIYLAGRPQVSLGDWISFSEYWAFQGILPDHERLLVERRLTAASGDSRVAIDIGANIGAFTLLLASVGATVHAFEPIPDTFCRLKKNLRFSGLLANASLSCFAVGERFGLVKFAVNDASPATNRMAVSAAKDAIGCDYIQMLATASLDQYCDEQRIDKIAFLKIDVEGMEPLVMRGARKLFEQRRIAAVLIEVCPVNLLSVGFTCAELYREFEIARYSPYLLLKDGTPGARLSLANIEAMSLANIVLLPDV